MRLISLLLVLVSMLTACSRNSVVSSNSPEPDTSPIASAASPSVTASNSPPATASELKQTYQEEKGAFKISFPSEYIYTKNPTGVVFNSKDGAFRGEVVFGSAQGNKYSSQELESFLKEAYKENLKLTEVNWQKTESQPDGSLRIDWTGKDPKGNVLDAESFVEQRGDTIYILTLSGVNKPYQNYFSDAQAIVGSYQVKEE